MLYYPDKIKSNNPDAYGIVDASEVSGFKIVQSVSDLYTISDAILSSIGDGSDAVGQEWYVSSTKKKYQLVDWETRNQESGWKELTTSESIYQEFKDHINNTDNPHQVSKDQVGLGNVDNTSDLDKPISTATQTELDKKVDKEDGKSLVDNDQIAKLEGLNDQDTIDAAIADAKKSGIDAASLAQQNKETIDNYTINGHKISSNPVLIKDDIGLDNVDNTADLDKPISTLTQQALDQKINKGGLKTINGQSLEGSGDITLDLSLYKIVSELPSQDIDQTKIYLVSNEEGSEQNTYTEYLYTGENWEIIGTISANTPLDSYLTADQIAELYIPKSEKGAANGVAPLGPNSKVLENYLPFASSSTRGAILLGYSQNNKSYPVELDENSRAFVTIPWISSIATESQDGLLSKEDKSKLDSINSNADSVSVSAQLNEGTLVAIVTINDQEPINIYAPVAGESVTYDQATSDILGLVKIGYPQSGKSYPVKLNTSGQMYVEVPWTDTTYQTASSSQNGLMSSSDKAKLDSIQQGATSVQYAKSLDTGVKIGTITINSEPIEIFAPQAGESVSYSQATSTELGLVKIGYEENGKNYPVELSDAGQMFVNVPWTDTIYQNATSSASGLMSSQDKAKLDGIQSGATSVQFNRSLSSGLKIGTIVIDGTSTDIYAPQAGESVGDGNTTYTFISGSDSNFYVTPSDGVQQNVEVGVRAASPTQRGGIYLGYQTNGKNLAVLTDDDGKAYVNASSINDTNTTYTFTSGTGGKFTVTPSNGEAQTVSIGTIPTKTSELTNDSNYVTQSWITSQNYLTSIPKATASQIGGIMIGYTQSGNNYPVVLDGTGKAYVTVDINGSIDDNLPDAILSDLPPAIRPTYTATTARVQFEFTKYTKNGGLPYTSSTDTSLMTLSSATTSQAGLMSAADKAKLDSLSEGGSDIDAVKSLALGTRTANTAPITVTKINNSTSDLSIPIASADYAGLMSASDKSAILNGVYYVRRKSLDATSFTFEALRNQGSPLDTTIPAATTTTAGLLTAADKVKLNGIDSTNIAYINKSNNWSVYQDFKSGAGNSGSDMRFKENVKAIPNVLNDLLKVPVIDYTWNKEGEQKRDTFGVSAQHLESLGGEFAKIVHEREDKDHTKWVEYDRLGVLAIKALQELVERQNEQIAYLQQQIDDLKLKQK